MKIFSIVFLLGFFFFHNSYAPFQVHGKFLIGVQEVCWQQADRLFSIILYKESKGVYNSLLHDQFMLLKIDCVDKQLIRNLFVKALFSQKHVKQMQENSYKFVLSMVEKFTTLSRGAALDIACLQTGEVIDFGEYSFSVLENLSLEKSSECFLSILAANISGGVFNSYRPGAVRLPAANEKIPTYEEYLALKQSRKKAR